MLVDRRVLGDQHPVGAVEIVHVEDLVVDLGRVVDDDQDLGLGVEIGARADRELIELEAASVAHGAFIPDCARACSSVELLERSCHLGLHLERLETLADAPFVARHDELTHLLGEARLVISSGG